MTKANESPSPTQTSPEPDWEAGVRRRTQEGRLLALGPAPVATGERAADVNAWIRRKTDRWLDLQHGNLLFGAEFALMFLSLFILMMLFATAITVDAYLQDGEMTWIPYSVVGGMNMLITVPWGLYMHFLGNKAVKETPPVRLNRQRREVAMPRWTEGKEFKLPFWNESAEAWAYVTVVFTIISVFAPFMLEDATEDYRNTIIMWALAALAIELLVIGTYLLVTN